MLVPRDEARVDRGERAADGFYVNRFVPTWRSRHGLADKDSMEPNRLASGSDALLLAGEAATRQRIRPPW